VRAPQCEGARPRLDLGLDTCALLARRGDGAERRSVAAGPVARKLMEGAAGRTMRVAIIAESFIPIVNGVSNSVLRVLEHLRREGHDAMVIAPRPPGWQPPTGDAPAGDAPVASTSEPGPGDTYAGFQIHRVPAVNLPPINSLPNGVPLPRVYKLLKQFQPDVVHLASPFVLGGAGVFAAKALKVPQVAVYQTDVPGFTEHYKLTFLLNMSWRWVRAMHNN